MKKILKYLSCIMIFAAVLMAFNPKSYAAEVQYTDNIIPTMTSNTSPSGVASASSAASYSGGIFYAWRAFDHNNANLYTAWATNDTTSGWLSYTFAEAKCIGKYTITSRNAGMSITETPKTWTFEGWDEQLSKWIILDTRTNETKWGFNEKREYTFENPNMYKKYRINISSNNGYRYIAIGELEMMEIVAPSLEAPTNLSAKFENRNVGLSWNAVDGATSYNIKRSTSSGTEIQIASVTGSAITFIDKDVVNGTTYYYVVTAVNDIVESANSNEVSVTPIAPANVLKLVLEVKEEKQLSVTEDLADNTNMIWTSSDASIACVDANGKVRALKPGDTVITCTSLDGDYIESINVLVVDLDLQLAIDLTIGDTCRLTVDDLANTTIVTWTAYDPTIATVSSKGKVTAVSEGLTYITAIDSEGIEIGRIYIRVR